MGTGIHILMGENGSGKTTLLKVLSGMSPYKGSVVLGADQEVRKHLRYVRTYVSYCEAEPVFPGFLQGQYLVDLYVKQKGGNPTQISELKGALRIDNYLTQKISSYSSGMKKKLALLLAFVGKPTLILLDEPFNTLDPPSQDALSQLIQSYAEKDTSFLMAMHHPPPERRLPIDGYWLLADRHITRISQEAAYAYLDQHIHS